MKKKIVYLLQLMTVLSFCALTAGAAAEYRPYSEEEYTIVDNVVYELDYDKKAKEKFYKVIEFFATDEAAEAAVKVSIRSEIDGIPVREIRGITGDIEFVLAYCAEESYPNVKSISIPDSIVKIGRAAFASLDGVEKLTIPDSVTYLSDYACSGMKSLKTVILSSNITSLSRDLFSQCTKLTSVKNMGKIKTISEDAFDGCISLKSFKIPSTVETIGGGAFCNTGLTSVTVPASVTDFGTDEDEGPIFKNCKKLTKVVFADRKADRLTIMFNTFENCTSLKKVYLPKSVKKIVIMHCAFKNCKKLTKVYNTDNVTVIEGDAFRGCKSLTGFTVPSKVSKIGEKAFYGCTKLKKVTFENSKTVPAIGKKAFGKTVKGIKFVAKNKKTAIVLKKKIKATGIKKPNVGYIKYVKV